MEGNMTDLDVLKEFRSELGGDLDEEGLEAAWAGLSRRIATGPIPAGRRLTAQRRRWVVPVGVAATVVALLLALPAILPSGAPGGARRAAAAVSFTEDGQYIVAVIEDPQADSQELTAAFAQHGLDISLQLLPVSPSFVGKFVFEGDSGTEGGPPIETLYDETADCTTPGGTSCPIGLRIPLGFQGHADLALGRAGQPGEEYASANDGFASGEALHCSDLRSMTVREALPVLDRLGVTAVWRSYDPAVDGEGTGIDPSTIAGQYVSDAVPKAEGQVYIWVTPDPPSQPEPGTPLADYFARLSRGC
jgi:hypothetical protein